MLSNDQIKELVGRQAADLVQQGMTVGIGTGSTAYWLIIALAEKIRNGFQCVAVPTSKKTKELAAQHSIQLADLNDVDVIDLTIDGADEINPDLQLIKGGGGALLQEKMVAAASRQFVVIADEQKYVPQLGKFPLPVEILPYGWKQTKKKIEQTGCKKVMLRMKNDAVFVTDHGHYILDCYFEQINDPDQLNSQLNQIPGLLENGLFINMADGVLIGYADGRTDIKMKPKASL
jgi:ribose 5-phosphate isomerase A